MPTLDEIRDAGEADLESLLKRLDERHKEILRDAIRQYGRVQDVPESVWAQMRTEIEDQTAVAIVWLLMVADDWTSEQIAARGGPRSALSPAGLSGYALDAARRARELATGTTSTIRDRLARKIEDSRLTGPGAVGDLSSQGIDQELDDVFTDQRRRTIATDATTQSISRGQLGARDRAGDGASTDGQRTTIELIWRTERDNLVCPRCSPLEGQPEEVWSLVFPEGPGPDAHPNCRCSLEPRVVIASEDGE